MGDKPPAIDPQNALIFAAFYAVVKLAEYLFGLYKYRRETSDKKEGESTTAQGQFIANLLGRITSVEARYDESEARHHQEMIAAEARHQQELAILRKEIEAREAERLRMADLIRRQERQLELRDDTIEEVRAELQVAQRKNDAQQ